jgi:effector-binding domain-containing protein
MSYDVRVEQVGSRPLAVVRRRAKGHELAKVVPEACGTVWSALRAQQVKGAGRHVALYWDDQINMEVGVEMDEPFAGHGEVIGSSTPSGTVATTVHMGPYGRLHEAHEAILQYCANHGYALAGPSWEVYGHWTADCDRDPNQIRTDISYLLTSDSSAADSG